MQCLLYPLRDYQNLSKFQQNVRLIASDFINIQQNFNKNARLTPCDLIRFQPNVNNTVRLTPCDFISFQQYVNNNAILNIMNINPIYQELKNMKRQLYDIHTISTHDLLYLSRRCYHLDAQTYPNHGQVQIKQSWLWLMAAGPVLQKYDKIEAVVEALSSNMVLAPP